MSKLVYKLWFSGDIINEWRDPSLAYAEVRAYYEAHLEEAHLLHLTTIKMGSKGRPATPVLSVHGTEILQYLNDVQDGAEDEAWPEDE